jgi:vancomycin resistance protein YoaR
MQSTYNAFPARRAHPIPPAAKAIRRTGTDFAVLFTLLLIGALVSGAYGWQLAHQQRIYTGVSVAGIPIGGLTRAGAITKLSETVPHQTLPALQLTWAERRWSIPPEQVWQGVDWQATVNQAYLLGRGQAFMGNLSEQLAATLGQIEPKPILALNQAELAVALSAIAEEIRKPATASTQIGALAMPGQPGIEVDIAATLQQVQTALAHYQFGELYQVPLAVAAFAPLPTTAAAPVPSTDSQVGRLAVNLFRLQSSEFALNFAIDPINWRAILLAQEPPQLNEAPLRSLLTGWATQIDRPARDAKLQFDTQAERVTVLQESLPGRRLDIDATVAAIYAALAAENTVSELAVVAVPPAVDSNRIAEMGIRELVASATSHFQGSSAERVHNIAVGAAAFEGIVIPPGGIFSFNTIVGDVSAANGFEDSLVIWGDQTVVGIGGGVCQVSTTVFRAAYNAGFSIVERYNHGYIVDWYGEPGLDATIYTPTVDFRFRNDNDTYLLIEPVVDHSRGLMTFNFYGTKPNRQVTLSEPVQSDISQPPAPEYRVDEALAPGQIRQVEWEKPGMQVAVTRTIVEDGVTRTDTITSHYQPWRAVYLVGPGTEVPQQIAASTE